MPNNINKGISATSIRRISSQVKKQRETTPADAKNKPVVSTLEEQVKSLKKLQQKTSATLKKPVAIPHYEKEVLTLQLKSLAAENHSLVDSMEVTNKEMEKYRELYLQAQTEVKAAIDEKEAAVRARLEAERSLQLLKTENEDLRSQLTASKETIPDKSGLLFLTADIVAQMVSSLKDELSNTMSGLDVKDIEVKLKVAVIGADNKSSFVLPTAESSPGIKDRLHEIVIRFDRSGYTSHSM